MSKLNAGILTIVLGLACLAGLPFGNALADTGGTTTASVTVKPQLDFITVTPKNKSVTLAPSTIQTVQFTAMANYTNAPADDVTLSALWTSSNTTVATIIPQTGLAVIESVGTTIITANYNGEIDSATLRVTSSSSGGNGGGGGGGGGSSGTTSLNDYITSEGKFVVEASAESADGKVKITIPKDTVGKNRNGVRLNFMSIKEQAAPAPPENNQFVCGTYDIGPSGSTFYPPVYLTFHYNDADIPQGVDENNLVIVYLQDNTWIKLTGGNVDTVKNTITVLINHLTFYTVMAETTAARLEVNGISFSPAEIYAKELVTVSATITNTGALFGNFNIVLKINNVESVVMKTSLGGYQSDKISFTLKMDKVGVYTADINGLSAGFTVNEPPPEGTVAEVTEPAEAANFIISGLSITPMEVRPDEEVTISATVSNTGGSSGRYIVVFGVDNKERARKEIALGAGQSQVVSFTISESMIGNYIIDVNGQAGDFTVKLAPPPPTTSTTLPEKPSFNWKPMVIIFAGMIIIVVVLVILYRRIHE